MKKLLYLGIILMLTSCGSGELDGDAKKFLVYGYAIDNVKSRIKDPSSIEIPSITEKVNHVKATNSEETEFRVESWFRSRNSFGGMVKNTFSCDVTISNDGNTIKGTNLVID